MSETLIQVQNLSRLFGHGKGAVAAVNDVSFTIRRGQVISLVGESGSGKTTVARMLLRLLEPTSGRILVEGHDVTSKKNRESHLAYWRKVQAVFQDPYASFNAYFSIHTCLERSLGILEKPLSRDEKMATMRHSLEMVGLNPNETLHKKPFELSGGQRQRVMIARALMVKPSFLVADEPTSGIDASTRASVLNTLLDINKKLGMTIMFITHDLGLAYYTSEEILVMSKGKLVEAGLAEQVVMDPQHEYTQRLLADVPRLHSRPTA